jgi:hypothetical protein
VDSDNEPPESDPNWEIELTAEEYTRIAASDNQRYTSPDPEFYDEASIKCEFVLDEKIGEGSIGEIRMIWEGYPGGSYYSSSDVTLWVWNFNSGSWTEGATVSCPEGQDTTITAIIDTDFDNYISSDGHVIFCAQNRRDSQRIITDYVEVRFTFEPSVKLYLDPGLIFWMQDVPPDGGTANCSYTFLLSSYTNTVEINWVLIPDIIAQSSNWKISLERDGVLVDPPGEMTGSGQPDSFHASDLPAGNYKANFWVQNNHSSRSLYTMPFSSSRAGSPDYTWLMIGSSYEAFIITSTARDGDGNMATIEAYAYRNPGPSGWWKQQTIEISTWLIDY